MIDQSLISPYSPRFPIHMQVIRALHLAGIEVLLHFGFSATAEESSPMSGEHQGMYGLGKTMYYR